MQRPVRFFRALLSLYPGDFRDEYGREMALVFSDRYRHAKSRIERVRIWIEAFFGVALEAPKEHYRMFLQDIRYALRTLRNNLMFTTTVVLALALGIGANSAVFSVLNAVVLRTLPIANPDELYLLIDPARKPSVHRSSWLQFEQFRKAGTGGAKIGAMSHVASMHTRIGGAAQSETINVQLISGELFDVLGISPIRGRLLTPDDNRTPGAHPVAVISYGCWQRRFGGSPDVIGQELTLNGTRFTVIGVTPEEFSGVWLEKPTEVWLPLAMQRDVQYSQNYSADGFEPDKPWMFQERVWWLTLIVRAPSGTEASASTAINTTFHQLLAQRAESIGNPEERRLFLQQRLVLDSFGNGVSVLRQRFMGALYALLAMAALVLLIACANVANLLLARAAGRRREIAVRLSLGAGRVRLLRQLFTESLLLVTMAAAIALLIARWTADFLVRMATATTNGPIPFSAEVDGRVVAFTAAVALTTALLFGLAPALRATRVDLTEALKAGARSISGGSGTRMPRLLVILQVALSLVLVTGTGLLVRSLQNALRIHLGFQQQHVISVAIDPRLAGYQQEQLPALYDRLLQRIDAAPGVQAKAFAMCGILASCRSAETGFDIESYQSRPGEQTLAVTNIVSPGYFATVGMRLKAGRLLDERDRKGTALATVVNEAFARRYFGNQSPLGKKFGYGVMNQEIVGVVEDARVMNVKNAPEPMAFFPLEQRPVVPRSIEVRTMGDPRQLTAAVRRAVVEVEPNLPIEGVATLSERVSNSLSQERLLLSLTSAFGILALGLAGLGLFGLLSYAVARRTVDFGIRLALGAPRKSVLWAVLRESLLLGVGGIIIGLPLVAAASSVAGSILFGVSAHDVTTIAIAATVLVAVAALAGLLPAWRASRVDPLVALRFE